MSLASGMGGLLEVLVQASQQMASSSDAPRSVGGDWLDNAAVEIGVRVKRHDEMVYYNTANAHDAKSRFAGVNADYPDQATAKLASEAWLAEQMKYWVA